MEFASSSSSSSSSSFLKSQPHFIYDVFINFGGEDIGRRLVSHLHSALLQAQLKTSINEDMREGMRLEEHMRAIASSKIAIIVFSKSYTGSTCSLHELDKIIECHETFGQILLPVFYEIDTLDVFEWKGFTKALEEAARKIYSGEQLEHAFSRWSRAITSIPNLDVRHFDHDAEFVGRIVRRVERLLDYNDLFTMVRYPVGLESHVERVIGCIENHSTKVCMLGIWGMAGSGKTTVAKAIYNRIYRTFIGKSFLTNIRQYYFLSEGDVHMQEKLLFDVLKSNLKVEGFGMGRTMIKNELSRKKLLIVLDGVSDFSELENLCGNREWFGQGTVIIITTRYVRLLKLLEVDYVYKIWRNGMALEET